MSGDAELERRLRQLLGASHPVAAAALVTAEGPVVATVGCPSDSDFEIGSVSKGITGLLYADALDRGEVQATTPLGSLLPLGSSPAAAVCLGEVSVHRSGLPRLPTASRTVRRSLALWRHGTNPYGETLEELLEQARRTRVGRPRSRYSNLGYELLGHAVAAAASTSYRELLDQRLSTPLGLRGMYAPASETELRASALAGRSRRGRERQPWTGEALAPAGGIRASVVDLADLIGALLTGEAPGVAALDPICTFGSRRVQIGAAWVTLTIRGRSVSFHNGGTGGFRSWLGLDRAAGVGAVVLGATSKSVDRPGFRLLESLA